MSVSPSGTGLYRPTHGWADRSIHRHGDYRLGRTRSQGLMQSPRNAERITPALARGVNTGDAAPVALARGVNTGDAAPVALALGFNAGDATPTARSLFAMAIDARSDRPRTGVHCRGCRPPGARTGVQCRGCRLPGPRTGVHCRGCRPRPRSPGVSTRSIMPSGASHGGSIRWGRCPGFSHGGSAARMPYPPSWPSTAGPGDATPAGLTRGVDAGDPAPIAPPAYRRDLWHSAGRRKVGPRSSRHEKSHFFLERLRSILHYSSSSAERVVSG